MKSSLRDSSILSSIGIPFCHWINGLRVGINETESSLILFPRLFCGLWQFCVIDPGALTSADPCLSRKEEGGDHCPGHGQMWE